MSRIVRDMTSTTTTESEKVMTTTPELSPALEKVAVAFWQGLADCIDKMAEERRKHLRSANIEITSAVEEQIALDVKDSLMAIMRGRFEADAKLDEAVEQAEKS